MEEDFENEQGMRGFIEAYEALPVLWDSRLSSYKNKKKRREAMVELLSIYQKMKPDATVKDMGKKINSMRVNYRKELKKVIASKRSGSSPESIYVPTSWTYAALTFLGDSQLPVDFQKNEEEVAEETENCASDVDSPSNDMTDINAGHSINSLNSPDLYTGPSISSIKSTHAPTRSRKRPLGPVSKQNELLSLACKFLKDGNEDSNDQYDNIGKVWADKLRSLEKSQRIFAEKAINDVLFEASLEQLNKYSVKINEPSTSALASQQQYSPGYPSINSVTNSSISSRGASRSTSPPNALSEPYFSTYTNLY